MDLDSLLTLLGTPALTVGGLWIFLHLRAGKLLDGYLGEKGKNLATREDFDRLLQQLERQTALTEGIKSDLAHSVWRRQTLRGERRECYRNLLDALHALKLQALVFSKVEKGDESVRRELMIKFLELVPALNSVRLVGSDEMIEVIRDLPMEVMTEVMTESHYSVLTDFEKAVFAQARKDLVEPGESENAVAGQDVE